MKAAIYLRCSTLDQNIEAQRDQLTVWAEQRGHEIVATYEDEGISGMKKRDARPQFAQMMKDATAGKFEIVAVWDMTRFGRSTADIATNIDELVSLGVHLYAATQGIDSTTPFGAGMMKMLGVFAEIENTIRRERCEAGRMRARKEGRSLGGRKVSHAPNEIAKDEEIAGLLRLGKPIDYIREHCRCGLARIRRVEREYGFLAGA